MVGWGEWSVRIGRRGVTFVRRGREEGVKKSSDRGSRRRG
jgi:hypothetical protein